MNEEKKEPQLTNSQIPNSENVVPENPISNSAMHNVELSRAERNMQIEREEIKESPITSPIPEIKEDPFTSVEEALASSPFPKTEENIDIPKEPSAPIIEQKNGETPKKKKSKTAPILIGIILLLILVVAILYFVLNSPKNLFLGAINKEYTQLMGKLNTNSYYEKAKGSSLVTEGNLKISISDIDESLAGTDVKNTLEELSKLGINYKYGLDYKNKKVALLTNVTYDEKDMMKINVYGKEKNMYIELKDLLSKYINMPYEELDSMFEDPNASIEDAKIVTKSVKDAFLSSLASKDFKKTNEKVQIEGKEEKVTKVSYTITEENINKISKTMAEKLKDDKKFIAILAKYSDKKEKELKGDIDKAIKELEDQKPMREKINISLNIYMKGLTNKTVQYEIAEGNDGISFAYQKGEKQKTIIVTENQKEFMKIVKEEKSSKQTKTVVTIPSLDIEGNIEKNEKENGNTYTFTFQDSKETFKITGTAEGEKKEKDKDISANANFQLKMEMLEKPIITINGTSSATSTIGKEVVVPEDVTNSIEIDNMGETESNEIMNNMMKNETLMNFLNKLIAMYTEESTYLD